MSMIMYAAVKYRVWRKTTLTGHKSQNPIYLARKKKVDRTRRGGSQAPSEIPDQAAQPSRAPVSAQPCILSSGQPELGSTSPAQNSQDNAPTQSTKSNFHDLILQFSSKPFIRHPTIPSTSISQAPSSDKQSHHQSNLSPDPLNELSPWIFM